VAGSNPLSVVDSATGRTGSAGRRWDHGQRRHRGRYPHPSPELGCAGRRLRSVGIDLPGHPRRSRAPAAVVPGRHPVRHSRGAALPHRPAGGDQRRDGRGADAALGHRRCSRGYGAALDARLRLARTAPAGHPARCGRPGRRAGRRGRPGRGRHGRRPDLGRDPGPRRGGRLGLRVSPEPPARRAQPRDAGRCHRDAGRRRRPAGRGRQFRGALPHPWVRRSGHVLDCPGLPHRSRLDPGLHRLRLRPVPPARDDRLDLRLRQPGRGRAGRDRASRRAVHLARRNRHRPRAGRSGPYPAPVPQRVTPRSRW
jgi:hypothetical protein